MANPIPLSVRKFTRRGVYSVCHWKSVPWKNCGVNGIVGSNNPVVRVDADGMADYFAFIDLDLFSWVGLSTSVGIVADISKPSESGLFVAPHNKGLGQSVGIGAGFGYAIRDVDGIGGDVDFNAGPLSISVLFDQDGWNGFGASLGVGGGISASYGDSKMVDTQSMSQTLFDKVLEPIRNVVTDNVLQPMSDGLTKSNQEINEKYNGN